MGHIPFFIRVSHIYIYIYYQVLGRILSNREMMTIVGNELEPELSNDYKIL